MLEKAFNQKSPTKINNKTKPIKTTTPKPHFNHTDLN